MFSNNKRASTKGRSKNSRQTKAARYTPIPFHDTSPEAIDTLLLENNIALIDFLLSCEQSILLQTVDGDSILARARTPEMCDVIIRRAEQHNMLSQLLAIKNEVKFTAFEVQANEGNTDCLRRLLQIKDFHLYIKIDFLLHVCRQVALTYPPFYQSLHEICLELRVMQRTHESYRQNINKLQANGEQMRVRHVSTFAENVAALYGSQFATTRNPKQVAIMRANIVFTQLLDDTERCLPLFKFMNNEFARYYRETHQQELPVPNCNHYEFKLIRGLRFPVPTSEYQHQSKHRALQSFLTALFRKYDMGHEAYQWIGYIPHDVADSAVASCKYVGESTYGTTLFHGKPAHMLQSALFIYAAEAGIISVNYHDENDRPCKLTIKELLASHVEKSTGEYAPESIWLRMRDTRARLITYRDPFQLTSDLMANGKSVGLDALANSLIDSTCNGLIKMHRVWQQTIPQLTSLNKFIDDLQDITLSSLIFPDFMRQHAIAKNSIFKRGPENKYALANKNYEPNPQYKPRTYTQRIA